MNVTFNADEIFEMAEQMERNGSEFYRRAAENLEDGSNKRKLLIRLAEMEDEHEIIFRKMRSEFSTPEYQAAFDNAPGNEVALYLRAIVDGYVFNVNDNPISGLTGEESLEEILRTAIKLEQDSIIFYLGMRDMVPDDEGKKKIEAILQEEKQHIVVLSQEISRN